MANRIQLRRDTAANWTLANPTLAQGEIGYEIDTSKAKAGDGSTAWNSLDYWVDPAGGGVIVDTSSYGSPSLITSSITVPSDNRARVFIKGNSAPVVDPTLGSGTGSQELHLFGTDNTNTVELNSTSNLLLSGKIIIRLGTYLLLHWVSGLNKWVEVSRNEI